MGYFWSPYLEIAIVFGLLLLGIAAPSHFRARNTGTILYICWCGLGNVVYLVNKLAWPDHIRNIAPLWCDISTKVEIGFSVSMVAATLVINRRLYKISRVSTVFVTPAQQRRDLIIELFIGIGIPVLVMILHVIVQGHRADIIQGIGCYPTIYNTPLAYPLVLMWPLVLSTIAMVYSLLSLRAWLKRRGVVEEFLNANSSALNTDRYFRLMCFSAVGLTISFPISLWVTLTNVINIPMNPWVSWDDTHYMFNRFNQVPAAVIEADAMAYTQFAVTLWSVPFLCYLFFIFFGFGREQVNQYKGWVHAALAPFGVAPPPPEPEPYSHGRRTWWQALFRRRAAATPYGTGLSSSRGATDSLPAFRHAEKPIPSARGRPAHAPRETAMTFDFDRDDEKADAASDLGDARPLHVVYDVNKALPSSPTVVVESLREDGDGDDDGKSLRKDNRDRDDDDDRNSLREDNGDGDDDRDSRRITMMSTSSTSSVAGSSRRVSAAIRDVELSETELRAIEARIQRMA